MGEFSSSSATLAEYDLISSLWCCFLMFVVIRTKVSFLSIMGLNRKPKEGANATNT